MDNSKRGKEVRKVACASFEALEWAGARRGWEGLVGSLLRKAGGGGPRPVASVVVQAAVAAP